MEERVAYTERLSDVPVRNLYYRSSQPSTSLFFFLNNTAPPEFYPLPLHAALPISLKSGSMISGVARTASRISGIDPSHRTSHQRRMSRMPRSARAAIGAPMTRFTPTPFAKSADRKSVV